MPGRSRIPLLAVALLVAVVVVGLGAVTAGVHTPRRASDPAQRGPNIVVITTDDQAVSQFTPETMPFTTQFFADRGVVFKNAIAAPPLCCPSRAGFLTGQYPHHHGVLTNDAGYTDLRGKRNVLPVWLQRAGYRTGLVGKFLNGYPVLGGEPAPGWDRWFAAGGEVGYRQFDVGDDGTARHFEGRRYSTDVYSRQARHFVSDSAQTREPFFLWLTYNAPHTVPEGQGACPGTRAQPRSRAAYRAFADAGPPSSPALGETDLADKGRAIRRKARRGPLRRRSIEWGWRCAVATLPAVDEGIERLVRRLKRLGELERTLLIFTSDNGYYYGEHGIPDGKELPYDPALRVPLAIAPPRKSARRTGSGSDAMVSNVDLAPTLLDYARARPCRLEDQCRNIDGRSLRPLLAGRDPRWSRRRAIPVELDDDFRYRALRTEHALYVEMTADPHGPLPRPAVELYDLDADPYELDNLWRTDRREVRARVRRLSRRLDLLTR